MLSMLFIVMQNLCQQLSDHNNSMSEPVWTKLTGEKKTSVGIHAIVIYNYTCFQPFFQERQATRHTIENEKIAFRSILRKPSRSRIVRQCKTSTSIENLHLATCLVKSKPILVLYSQQAHHKSNPCHREVKS